MVKCNTQVILLEKIIKHLFYVVRPLKIKGTKEFRSKIAEHKTKRAKRLLKVSYAIALLFLADKK